MESAQEAASGPRRGRTGFADVPRTVRWIIYVNAAGGIGFGYLMIFITAYFPQIGIDAGTVGLLLGANGAAMVLCAVPLGLYSDRRGRKRPLLAASAVLPFMILVFGLTRDLAWLLFASVVAGIAEGALLSTWNAIIADQTTPDQRSAAFALSFGLGAGFFIPLLATWLLLKHGVTDTFSGPILAGSNITIGLAAVSSATLAK